MTAIAGVMKCRESFSHVSSTTVFTLFYYLFFALQIPVFLFVRFLFCKLQPPVLVISVNFCLVGELS